MSCRINEEGSSSYYYNLAPLEGDSKQAGGNVLPD